MTDTNWCVRDKAQGRLLAYNMTEAEAKEVERLAPTCEAVETLSALVPARPRPRPAPGITLTEQETAQILGQYQVQVKDGRCIIT